METRGHISRLRHSYCKFARPLLPTNTLVLARQRVSTTMWPLAETVVNGRGRCLVASRDIAAGETVLSEQPALLFVHPEFEDSVCACCLRTVQGVPSGEHKVARTSCTYLTSDNNRGFQCLLRALSALSVRPPSQARSERASCNCITPPGRFCSAKCNEESSHRGGAHSPEVCAGLRFLSACTGVGIEVPSRNWSPLTRDLI
jgi:hypothetical protein